MIKKILFYIVMAMLIALALVWLLSGGWSQIVRTVKHFPNPIDIIWGNSTSTYGVELPWQISVPQGPDISGLADDYAQYESANTDPQSQLTDLQNQYSDLQTQIQATQSLGVLSPYRGHVSLKAGTAAESSNEYVEIEGISSSVVSLQGWSIVSLLSGARLFLPQAADPYVLGGVNILIPPSVERGSTVLVYSGRSPVGVSFRENRCSGYLEQLQSFEPSLSSSCPDASEVLPLNAENIRRYGSNCIDYSRTISDCTFPSTLPSTLTPICRSFLTNTFSYNGCVGAYRGTLGFDSDEWRLYLSGTGELWSNSHDVLRLLDAQGKTVDSITY